MKIVIKSRVKLHLRVFCSTDVDGNFVAMARLLRVSEILPIIIAVFFVIINHNDNKIRLPPTPLGYHAKYHNSQGSTPYSGL